MEDLKGCKLINMCKQKHLCCYYCNNRCEFACRDVFENCMFRKQLSNKVDIRFVTEQPIKIPKECELNELPKKQPEFRTPLKKDLLALLKK